MEEWIHLLFAMNTIEKNEHKIPPSRPCVCHRVQSAPNSCFLPQALCVLSFVFSSRGQRELMNAHYTKKNLYSGHTYVHCNFTCRQDVKLYIIIPPFEFVPSRKELNIGPLSTRKLVVGTRPAGISKQRRRWKPEAQSYIYIYNIHSLIFFSATILSSVYNMICDLWKETIGRSV